jgi:hypothetical protein
MGKRSRQQRAFDQASGAIVKWSSDPRRLGRLRRKRRRVVRLLKAIGLMVAVPFVLIPVLIASGLLFGPSGTEGLIWTPLLLLSAWAAILYWGLRKSTALPSRSSIAKTDLAALPAQTEEWLDQERKQLPSDAHVHVDNISLRLEALGPQLQSIDAQTPAAVELRRLLAEELPDLVRGYRKVPLALAKQPLYGGTTPERQLLEGLETIEAQIGRVHERLAKDDLHALATHQRYLELKYKREDESNE